MAFLGGFLPFAAAFFTGFFADFAAAFFTGFLTDFFTGFLAVFFTGFFADLFIGLTAFLVDFFMVFADVVVVCAEAWVMVKPVAMNAAATSAASSFFKVCTPFHR